MLLIPPLLVFLFVGLTAWGLPEGLDDATGSGRKAVAYLAALPTSLGFYLYLALLVGLVGAWRFWVHLAPAMLGQQLVEDESRSVLHERIAHTQRRRALSLRTGATFLLAGVLVLLAGGLYLVLFVLPTVLGSYDPETALQGELEKRYGASLDDLVAGRFWLSVPREGRLSSATRQNQLLAFSEDAKFGVAALGSSDQERGPILVSTDRGRSWSRRPGIELARGDVLKSVEFAGVYVLTVTQHGAVFKTTHRADSWEAASSVDLNPGELVASTWWKRDDDAAVVLGREGTVKWTRPPVWGETWTIPDWSLDWNGNATADDWIIYARFSNDGSTGVVARQSGRVHLLRKNDNWGNLRDLIKPYAPLGWYDEPVAASFSADGQYGVLGGPFRFLRVTENGAESWGEPRGGGLEEIRGWAAAALAENAPNGVLLGVEGSVFVTDDYGSSWSRKSSLELGVGETLAGKHTITFSADAMQGVVVGSAGSLFVTNDGGNSWHITAGLDTVPRLSAVAMVASEAGLEEPDSAVGIDVAGGFHLLTHHGDLAEWRRWSTSQILTRLRALRVRRESVFLENLEGFLSSQAGTPGTRRPAVGGYDIAGDVGLNTLLNPLLFLRMFTLTVVFFLVALLVRLYQYSLRLAAFWESRSDAVLLAGERLASDSQSFAKLVDALSPDTHDFKRGPQSVPERAASLRFWNKRNS